MKHNPKVSIRLSSYNHEKYLRASIDSVLNQTYSDFIVYILDDASIDDSWNIIKSYSDPRIRAFRNLTNQHGDFSSFTSKIMIPEYAAVHHSDDKRASDLLGALPVLTIGLATWHRPARSCQPDVVGR